MSAPNEPPLQTLLATPTEIIVLLAAIRHFLDEVVRQGAAYQQAAPLLQRFQARLYDQLPHSKGASRR